MMADTIHSSAFVHPTAVVDDGAILHEGVKVWHFCHVMPLAIVGAQSSLGQNTFVASEVKIGARAKIQNNVSLYQGVELEDDVFLGPSCVFTNVRNPRGAVNRQHAFEPTLVKQGASVGANATIRCGVTLGRYSFIAAGAVVTSDVPDYALVAGVPARQVGWVSEHGCNLTLDEQGRGTCPESGHVYQLSNQALHRR